MAEEQTHCGVVALLGAPNAGKSTLTNALVGAKVAIVSPKVQTTRSRLIGIAIAGSTQLMLVDTPGIFAPRRRLDRAMVRAAWDGATDADLVALLVDVSQSITENVDAIVENLQRRDAPKILVLNKIDLAPRQKLLESAAALNARLRFDDTFMISAEKGSGVADLKAYCAGRMPAGPWHFPEDQITDMSQRLLATEITREKLFLQLHEELPYSASVETESWTDRKDGSAELRQIIYIERDSQKPIVLGKGGKRIKALGQAARIDMEEMFGRRVHLLLFVKVKPDWADDRQMYNDFGLDWSA